MDLKSTKCYQSPSYFTTQVESAQPQFNGEDKTYGKNKMNPFADTFAADPLCKLNLKETSEFVRSFPMSLSSTTATNNNHDVNEKRRDSSVRKTGEHYSPAATPGRPVFSFSSSGFVKPRKSLPSKWDDAEKWLFGNSTAAVASCHESSPAHHHAFHVVRSTGGLRQQQCHEVFMDKSRVTDEQDKGFFEDSSSASAAAAASFASSDFHNSEPSPPHVLLKDKVTNEVDNKAVKPEKYLYSSEPTKEGFFFRNQLVCLETPMKDASTATGTMRNPEIIDEIKLCKHRDIGTEMTPLGSSTTSRCHTPIKNNSPARHNTPVNRSGPLALTAATTCSNHHQQQQQQQHQYSDVTQLQECHLAKLQIGTTPFSDSIATTNWSSREEEEEDVSKSLRHFEIRRSVSENDNRGGAGGCASWEDDEKTKFCLRYQREEARIQAWVNLQSAKAEAQSRKLEVKIEKMRSDLEERLMKRMAAVHKKAEEWRAAALLEHSEQIKKANERANKSKSHIINRRNSQITNCYASCGCLPCNNLLL